jgi:hypothetical protein
MSLMVDTGWGASLPIAKLNKRPRSQPVSTASAPFRPLPHGRSCHAGAVIDPLAFLKFAVCHGMQTAALGMDPTSDSAHLALSPISPNAEPRPCPPAPFPATTRNRLGHHHVAGGSPVGLPAPGHRMQGMSPGSVAEAPDLLVNDRATGAGPRRRQKLDCESLLAEDLTCRQRLFVPEAPDLIEGLCGPQYSTTSPLDGDRDHVLVGAGTSHSWSAQAQVWYE